MRLPFKTSLAVLLCLAATACAGEQQPALVQPNAIIVRDFSLATAAVTLDPSFGFSLYRGAPGVPPRQRAGGVSRAVAFTISDAIVEQLRQGGYDVVRSDGTGVEPAGPALIVVGRIGHINEGHRRRVGAESPSVAADGEIDYRTGPAAAVQRLSSFALDSRQLPRERITSNPAGRNEINAAAARLGHAIAQAVLEVARRNNWPGTAR